MLDNQAIFFESVVVAPPLAERRTDVRGKASRGSLDKSFQGIESSWYDNFLMKCLSYFCIVLF